MRKRKGGYQQREREEEEEDTKAYEMDDDGNKINIRFDPTSSCVVRSNI